MGLKQRRPSDKHNSDLQLCQDGEVMVRALDDKVDEHAQGDGTATRLLLLGLHEGGWKEEDGIPGYPLYNM